mmetsp:Transcript_13839/g.11809  ORF Transcript_13839/g.11809 Transcript_13839/m.11809 type:complete len:114 (-) Transcript_13839:435-776(-)
MKRQTERNDPLEKQRNEEADILLLDPDARKVIEPPIKGMVELKKQVTREDLEKPQPERDEILITPNDKLTKPDNSHAVSMNSKTKRFEEKPKDDPNDGRFTTDQRIDYDKAYS